MTRTSAMDGGGFLSFFRPLKFSPILLTIWARQCLETKKNIRGQSLRFGWCGGFLELKRSWMKEYGDQMRIFGLFCSPLGKAALDSVARDVCGWVS